MGLGEQSFVTFALAIDSFFMMAYISLSHRRFVVGKSFYVYTVLAASFIQTLLAFLGYVLGHQLLYWIQNWDHWVVFLFFSYLAWKQWDFKPDEEYSFKKLSYWNMLLLAVMCSVDAFIVTIPLVDLFWSIKSYFFSIFFFTLLLSSLGPLLFHLIRKSNFVLSSKAAAILIFF